MRKRSGTSSVPNSCDVGLRFAIRDVHRVALRRDGEIDHGIRERELALGDAEPLERLPRIERERRARGSARPMSSMAMRTMRRAEVARIAAAVEHAREPVQRGIGIGAAHRLVQRRDLVVELLAALVEAATPARGDFAHAAPS